MPPKIVIPCRSLGESVDQCPDCVKHVHATASRKKKLRCHRTSRRPSCLCAVCSSLPPLPQQPEIVSRQRRSGRRQKRAASGAGPGDYREDAQTTEAARVSQFRSKKSRRARAEEARMDGMDTTIQNADDMDVDGDNFPLDIDHDGTLVLSAPACCMRHY